MYAVHDPACAVWSNASPSSADRYMQRVCESAERAVAVCLFVQFLALLVVCDCSRHPAIDRNSRFDF
jgi:hypothetical protein